MKIAEAGISTAKPRRWLRATVGTKQVATLLIVALVPLGVVAFVSVEAGSDAVEAAELRSVEGAATFGAGRISQILEATSTTVGRIGVNPIVVAALSGGPSGGPSGDETCANDRCPPGASAEQMLTIEVGTTNYTTFVSDLSGVVKLASDASLVGTQIKDEDWFAPAASGQTMVSDVVEGTQTGTLSVFVATPARPPNQATIGVAVVELRADVLVSALAEAPLGEGAQAVLVNRYGLITGSSDSRLRFHSLGNIPAKTAKSLLDSGKYPVESFPSLGQDAFAKRVAKHDRGADIDVSLSSSGDAVAFARVVDQPFTALVVQPRSIFLAPIDRLARSNVNILIVVAALVLVTALLAARLLIRPIRAVTKAAAAIRRNELPDEAELTHFAKRSDELGELAVMFEMMSEEVRDRQARLEAQVAALKVVVDADRRSREVANITETDFFRDLEARATAMRQRMQL